MLSIVIPTLNEEKNLPLLLNSIKKQDFKDLEIIVADAGSKDKTRVIAKKYGCRVVGGGLPAKGRNEGAKSARGDMFLFLDADVVLPGDFLKKTFKEFYEKKLDIAGFFIVPSDGFLPRTFFNVFYNFPILLFEKIIAHAAMGILVKKKFFDGAGGFDEAITLAEDHYFARQVKKIKGKYGIIKGAKIYTCSRRFKKDGWIRTGLKFFACELHMIFLGPVKKDLFKYNYTHLKKQK
ncbi:MAG: glycosyltransferase [bacterium]|nr:glycosyltransferase [bacterium]